LKAALNFAFAEGKVASDLEWRRVAPFPTRKVCAVDRLHLDGVRRELMPAVDANRHCVDFGESVSGYGPPF
jgi:hypothetical protein